MPCSVCLPINKRKRSHKTSTVYFYELDKVLTRHPGPLSANLRALLQTVSNGSRLVDYYVAFQTLRCFYELCPPELLEESFSHLPWDFSQLTPPVGLSVEKIIKKLIFHSSNEQKVRLLSTFLILHCDEEDCYAFNGRNMLSALTQTTSSYLVHALMPLTLKEKIIQLHSHPFNELLIWLDHHDRTLLFWLLAQDSIRTKLFSREHFLTFVQWAPLDLILRLFQPIAWSEQPESFKKRHSQLIATLRTATALSPPETFSLLVDTIPPALLQVTLFPNARYSDGLFWPDTLLSLDINILQMILYKIATCVKKTAQWAHLDPKQQTEQLQQTWKKINNIIAYDRSIFPPQQLKNIKALVFLNQFILGNLTFHQIQTQVNFIKKNILAKDFGRIILAIANTQEKPLKFLKYCVRLNSPEHPFQKFYQLLWETEAPAPYSLFYYEKKAHWFLSFISVLQIALQKRQDTHSALLQLSFLTHKEERLPGEIINEICDYIPLSCDAF